MTIKEKCDFCSTLEIVWVYPAATFQVEGTPHYSAGDWDACHDCAALIEAGDREGLADRSMAGLPPPVRGNVRSRKRIRSLHAQFFAARRGPARPVVKGS